MRKHLVINGVDFEVGNFEEQLVKNEESNEDLKEISFTFFIVGESENNLYQAFFNASQYEVVIPETNEMFKAHKESLSYSYNATSISTDTRVDFRIVLKQESEIEPEGPLSDTNKLLASVAKEAIEAKMKLKALMEILEERELITQEQIQQRLKENFEEDFKKFQEELFIGITD
ncbi:hypothetical protein CIB87_28060 [Priestia megaterium]|uniref:Uncharacterized protein n=1 Tax=Priestia megaterium TaxID=1404 RepID=A0AA86IF21_PRIMG|nr:hypothetical protein [Priestia megaterium]AXI32646.1 hypothetical protein CIB87_28060 [Priestia megaterium]